MQILEPSPVQFKSARRLHRILFASIAWASEFESNLPTSCFELSRGWTGVGSELTFCIELLDDLPRVLVGTELCSIRAVSDDQALYATLPNMAQKRFAYPTYSTLAC